MTTATPHAPRVEDLLRAAIASGQRLSPRTRRALRKYLRKAGA